MVTAAAIHTIAPKCGLRSIRAWEVIARTNAAHPVSPDTIWSTGMSGVPSDVVPVICNELNDRYTHDQ